MKYRTVIIGTRRYGSRQRCINICLLIFFFSKEAIPTAIKSLRGKRRPVAQFIDPEVTPAQGCRVGPPGFILKSWIYEFGYRAGSHQIKKSDPEPQWNLAERDSFLTAYYCRIVNLLRLNTALLTREGVDWRQNRKNQVPLVKPGTGRDTLGETEFLKKLAMLGPGLAPDGPVSGPGFLPGLFLFSDNFDFFMLLHFLFWRK